MIVGVRKFVMHFPYCQNLKQKRQILRKLKDTIKNGFNVSIAEVDANEKWQKGVIAICAVSNDSAYLNSMFDKISQKIEITEGAEILNEESDQIAYNVNEPLSFC